MSVRFGMRLSSVVSRLGLLRFRSARHVRRVLAQKRPRWWLCRPERDPISHTIRFSNAQSTDTPWLLYVILKVGHRIGSQNPVPALA